MNAKRVLLRADASLTIGTGHVMRCLALADGLVGRGWACHFVCAEVPGHLGAEILRRGHGLTLLTSGRLLCSALPFSSPLPTMDELLPHADWLPWDWAYDAAATRDICVKEQAAIVVVDHYALDARWERAIAAAGVRRVLVIDDIADRRHHCDLLLDQNLGRRDDDYRLRVQPDCRLLIGPQYALLRPGFAARRQASLDRRRTPRLRQTLIAMGGVDQDNLTARALSAFAAADPGQLEQVVVVLGPHAPWVDAVRGMARSLPVPCKVMAGVGHMEELMLESDLAIGASGSTAWERCCLGVPSVAVILADNQRSIGRALAEAGCALVVQERAEQPMLVALRQAIRQARRPEVLQALSQKARALCDGLGVGRVCRELLLAI